MNTFKEPLSRMSGTTIGYEPQHLKDGKWVEIPHDRDAGVHGIPYPHGHEGKIIQAAYVLSEHQAFAIAHTHAALLEASDDGIAPKIRVVQRKIEYSITVSETLAPVVQHETHDRATNKARAQAVAKR